MKNLKTTIMILFGLLTLSVVNAQKKDKALTYQLEYEYTGEVTPELDSTFKVYCVFDRREIKSIKKLNVKSGRRYDNLKTEIINLDDKNRVLERNKRVFIEIGKSGEETSVIEIYTEDNTGNINKSNHKPKKQ